MALTAVPAFTAASLPGGQQWTFGLAGKAPAGLRQSHPARWSWAGLLPVPDAVGASAKVAVSPRVADPTIARRCCLPFSAASRCRTPPSRPVWYTLVRRSLSPLDLWALVEVSQTVEGADRVGVFRCPGCIRRRVRRTA